ncbi:MAG TPA: hypothetical protein VJ994_04845 [Paracoccaceae bacterium]|nr:hypothetical protein [Paracoccaceae bacterium]
MLIDALTGLLLGAAAAALFLGLVATGIERLNQGLVSSLGFLGLIAACLWLDGWILTAIPGFALAVAAWSVLRHRLP